jgi:hypothetical protein
MTRRDASVPEGGHLSDRMELDPIEDGFIVDRPGMGGPSSE